VYGGITLASRWQLPEYGQGNTDSQRIEACPENGVLTIQMAKSAVTKPKSITVKVERDTAEQELDLKELHHGGSQRDHPERGLEWNGA